MLHDQCAVSDLDDFAVPRFQKSKIVGMRSDVAVCTFEFRLTALSGELLKVLASRRQTAIYRVHKNVAQGRRILHLSPEFTRQVPKWDLRFLTNQIDACLRVSSGGDLSESNQHSRITDDETGGMRCTLNER